MSLPKRYEFIEISGGSREYMTDVRSSRVSGSDGICPIRQCDVSIRKKIDNYFNFSLEAVHVPWLVIVGVHGEPNAVEVDLSH